VTSPGESAETQSQVAAQRVESEIVSGALAPGARLGITEMAARFGVGATPLREALSRLVARGLVDAIGQRGFRVKGISRDDLADIVEVRTLIEREALRRSMVRGDADWEATIVAALHRLRRYVTANAEGFREGDAEFDALHKSFHVALIAACGSPRMLAALSDLYDQAYRYRRLMMAEFRESSDFLAAHDQLAELAIARRHGEAEQAIGFHIGATLRHVYPEAADPAR
jgi:GntR family transcriptional regulator, carbon starvation induced regulator